jgi:hypothetical protein
MRGKYLQASFCRPLRVVQTLERMLSDWKQKQRGTFLEFAAGKLFDMPGAIYSLRNNTERVKMNPTLLPVLILQPPTISSTDRSSSHTVDRFGLEV